MRFSDTPRERGSSVPIRPPLLLRRRGLFTPTFYELALVLAVYMVRLARPISPFLSGWDAGLADTNDVVRRGAVPRMTRCHSLLPPLQFDANDAAGWTGWRGFSRVRLRKCRGIFNGSLVARYLLREIGKVVRVPAMYWVSMTLT